MKKRTAVRKLALNKETIAVLEARELNPAIGADDYTTVNQPPGTFSNGTNCPSICVMQCYNGE
jgi:hypothetical protein